MTDIVTRLRAEDPESGLRLSIASEAADRLEELERELTEEIHSRKIAAKRAWEFSDRIKKLELAMVQIMTANLDPCDKYCGHFLDMQALAADALKGME